MFHNEDAMTAFLNPGAVDLFITNPPFYGLHAEEYGSVSKQLHNTENISTYVDNLVTVTKNMEQALTDTGTILMILPNKNFIFEYIAKITSSTSLKFGQALFWDLNKPDSDAYATQNNSAIILNLYLGQEKIVPNNVIHVPLVVDETLASFSHLGHIHDALPTEIYTLLINLFSKKDDVVADILGGTGEICIAATETNRSFIYNDVSASQVELAKARYYAIIN
jgi:DNA modification methylase